MDDASHHMPSPQHFPHAIVATWFLVPAQFVVGIIMLLMGPFCDRFGRRVTLLISCIIYLVSCIMCSLTVNIEMLIVSRALQGAAGEGWWKETRDLQCWLSMSGPRRGLMLLHLRIPCSLLTNIKALHAF